MDYYRSKQAYYYKVIAPCIDRIIVPSCRS